MAKIYGKFTDKKHARPIFLSKEKTTYTYFVSFSHLLEKKGKILKNFNIAFGTVVFMHLTQQDGSTRWEVTNGAHELQRRAPRGPSSSSSLIASSKGIPSPPFPGPIHQFWLVRSAWLDLIILWHQVYGHYPCSLGCFLTLEGLFFVPCSLYGVKMCYFDDLFLYVWSS